MACRLAMSATFGNYTYKLNPENEYLLLHAKPAWEALDFIWGCDGRGAGGVTANLIDNAFNRACDDISVPDGSSIPNCVDLSFPDPTIPDPFSSSRIMDSKSAQTVNCEKDNSTITFVTGNKKKAEEVKRILASGSTSFPFKITNKKVDLPELQGDPVYIAREKAALAAKEVNGAVITEDTSLCFSALNDLPG